MKYFDTARGRRSARSTSWRAARCRRAFRPSRSTASPIGTAASSPTRRCNTCSTERPARGHVHLPDRSLQRQGARAAKPVRHRAAREGDPLFEPHAPQHRYLLRASDHSPGHSPFAADAAGASSPAIADWQLLDRLSCDAAITIVQLIHRRAAYSTQSNDYEFSRYTIEEHWRDGPRRRRADAQPSRRGKAGALRGGREACST